MELDPPIAESEPQTVGSATNVSKGMDIDAMIDTNKGAIRDILTKSKNVSDISLLQGTLSFCHSKFTSYILDALSNEYLIIYADNPNNPDGYMAQNQKNDLISKSIGNIVDRVWIEIHHPTIKYFQSTFYEMGLSFNDYTSTTTINKRQNSNKSSKFNNNNNNNNNNGNNNGNNNSYQLFVEYKKLFDRFVKFIAKAYDFYFLILKSLLNTYDLSIYIPVKKICSTLKIDLDSISSVKDSRLPLPDSNHLVSSIIYLTHKCVLFIGDLSRYRTLIAKTYLPSTAVSKEDNNNYSKSIELYKLSLLILPSLGDPYNHIAIIDNLKDDKFNVVYNFIRASLTSSPLKISYSNLLNLLSKHPRTNSILRKFEHLNALDRNTITKNDRLSLLKSQFLILFNYNLLPNKWKLKKGYLISGHSIDLIEKDFYYLLSTLDFHKQIFNDFYFKQLVILTGGFELLIDEDNSTDSKLNQSTEIISDYLQFLFRYLETFLKICIALCDYTKSNNGNTNSNIKLAKDLTNKVDLNDSNQKFSMSFSTSLLPVIRLLLCWFKEREIARIYLQQSKTVSYLLATLINKLLYYIDRSSVKDTLKNLLLNDKWNNDSSLSDNFLNASPIRQRLFKEDVALREFKPINYILTDFDDSHLYRKDAESVLALIGELQESVAQPNIQDEIDGASDNSSDADTKKKSNSVGTNTKVNDNLLRLVAIVSLGKKLIIENSSDIEWIDSSSVVQDNDAGNNDSKHVTRGFSFTNDVDLKIHAPVIPKVNSNNVTNNASNTNNIGSNGNHKVRDSTKHSKMKKVDGTKNANNVNSSASMSYAGSSFSDFGSPPRETFGKFDKFKKGKSADKVPTRPQSTSDAKNSGSTLAMKKFEQRPQTTPEYMKDKFSVNSKTHSQYIEMVASIVNDKKNDDVNDMNSNEGNNNNYNNKTKNKNKNKNKIKKKELLKSNDFTVGNIGITKDQSSKENVDCSSNVQQNSPIPNNCMNYFNSWNSPNINNTDTRVSDRKLERNKNENLNNSNNGNGNNEIKRDDNRNDEMGLINQMNQMDLITQMNQLNGFGFDTMRGFGDLNRFDSIDNDNSLTSMPSFGMNNMNLGGMINNSINMRDVNLSNMNNMSMNDINNLNNINMNRMNQHPHHHPHHNNTNNTNAGNTNHMNYDNSRMSSIGNMNNMHINNLNNMNHMNLDNVNMKMNDIRNMHMNSVDTMNMNMDMNMNMNMNMNNSFSTLSNINNYNNIDMNAMNMSNLNMNNISMNNLNGMANMTNMNNLNNMMLDNMNMSNIGNMNLNVMSSSSMFNGKTGDDSKDSNHTN